MNKIGTLTNKFIILNKIVHVSQQISKQVENLRNLTLKKNKTIQKEGISRCVSSSVEFLRSLNVISAILNEQIISF